MRVDIKGKDVVMKLSIREAKALKKLVGAVSPSECEDRYGLTQPQSGIIYDA